MFTIKRRLLGIANGGLTVGPALRWAAPAAIVMCCWATACGGSGTTDEVPPWIADAQPRLAEGWEEWPRAQRAAVADGDLTFDEYEKAFLAKVQCVLDAGLVLVEEPGYDEIQRRMTFSTIPGPGFTGSLEERSEIGDRCALEHSAFLEALWGVINMPTADEIATAQAAMSDCLQEAGVDGYPAVGSAPFQSWVLAPGVPEPAVGCLASVSTEHGTPPW